ncbi:MAG: BLUF domain-containing protein [Thiolinea sp.]
MKALVYTSQACGRFDAAALQDLCDRAAAHNQHCHITGYLHYHGGHFMQYLEGQASSVDELMARIGADERHRIHKMVSADSLPERRFPQWHMQWLQTEQLVQIRLEHIQYDFMLLKTSPLYDEDPTIPKIWQLIDRIAAARQRLTFKQ